MFAATIRLNLSDDAIKIKDTYLHILCCENAPKSYKSNRFDYESVCIAFEEDYLPNIAEQMNFDIGCIDDEDIITDTADEIYRIINSEKFDTNDIDIQIDKSHSDHIEMHVTFKTIDPKKIFEATIAEYKTVEFRIELNEYLQGLVIMDDITRDEQYEILSDFDRWAETAKYGDDYFYDCLKCKIKLSADKSKESDDIDLD